MRGFVGIVLFMLSVALPGLAQTPNLNAAVLPGSRAVDTGTAATFFATIANSGTGNASTCAIGLSSAAPVGMTVSYQTTDATNALTGTANTPVAIAAGASQTFLISLASSAAFTGKAALTFFCTEGSANSFAEVNQPDVRFTSAKGPDIIAIGATLSNDGIAVLDRGPNLAAMSIAALNIGGATAVASAPSKPQANESPITVTGELTGFFTAGQYQVLVCETDAAGICQAPLNTSVAANIGNTASTFSAFLVGDPNLGLAFFPSEYRLRIIFTDSNGIVVGSTSVALNSDTPASAGTEPVGYWEGNIRLNNDTTGENISKAVMLVPPANLQILGFIINVDPVTGEALPQVFRMDGQFDPATNTRTGNLLFFDVQNIVGGSFAATLAYEPGKQITLSYVVPAPDKPVPASGSNQRAPAGTNPLSGLLGGSGSGSFTKPGTENLLSGILGGSGSGSGSDAADLSGNLGGKQADNVTPDNLTTIPGSLTIDKTAGTVTYSSTQCSNVTVDTTPVTTPKVGDPPFGPLNIVGIFVTIAGCPVQVAATPNLDGYLFFQRVAGKVNSGKKLTPLEQKFVNFLGAAFGGPFGTVVGITAKISASSQTDFNAIMRNITPPAD